MDLSTYDMHHEPFSLDDDSASIASSQGGDEGMAQSLDDILNNADSESDSVTEGLSTTYPNPDSPSQMPATPGRSSSRATTPKSASDVASIISSVKTILSSVSKPKATTMAKTLDQRPDRLARLITDSEKHCMQLINDRGEMQQKLNEAVLETLVCKKDIAQLQQEKGDLSRALDDARQEIAKLKKKVQYCDREHLFFN